MKIFLRTRVAESFDRVVAGFDSSLFKALKPPLMNLSLKQFDGCKKGDKVHLQMGIGPLSQEWISLITYDHLTTSQFKFIDEGTLLPPPLKKWEHIHMVDAIASGGVFITDNIDYTTNNKWLDVLIYPAMYVLFWLRKPVYKRYFKTDQQVG